MDFPLERHFLEQLTSFKNCMFLKREKKSLIHPESSSLALETLMS